MATTEEQIIDYVLKTPSNTNPQILRQLLEEQGSGGIKWNIIHLGVYHLKQT